MKKWLAGSLFLSMIMSTVGCNNSSFLKNIPFTEPDLTVITDGVYRGSYALALPAGQFVGSSSATVDVCVSNRRYQWLTLVAPEIDKDSKIIKDYLNRVVLSQKVDIDGVTGCSYTTVSLKKAIEIALISNTGDKQ